MLPIVNGLNIQSGQQCFKISGFYLAACQDLFDRRQLQDHAKDCGKGAMAEQDLVIKNQMLQFIPFNSHDHCPVGAVKGRDDPFGKRH